MQKGRSLQPHISIWFWLYLRFPLVGFTEIGSEGAGEVLHLVILVAATSGILSALCGWYMMVVRSLCEKAPRQIHKRLLVQKYQLVSWLVGRDSYVKEKVAAVWLEKRGSRVGPAKCGWWVDDKLKKNNTGCHMATWCIRVVNRI